MTFKKVVGAIVVGALATALSTGLALAEPKQDKGGMPKMDPAAESAMMAEMMKTAGPGPEHRVFEASIGKWKIVTKQWMGPGDPVVTDGTGESEWI